MKGYLIKLFSGILFFSGVSCILSSQVYASSSYVVPIDGVNISPGDYIDVEYDFDDVDDGQEIYCYGIDPNAQLYLSYDTTTHGVYTWQLPIRLKVGEGKDLDNSGFVKIRNLGHNVESVSCDVDE